MTLRSGRVLALTASVVLVLGGLGACSDGDDGDGNGGARPVPEETTTASTEPETTSTAAEASGCTGPAPEMSQPANQGEVVDVDGDGRRDTVWMASPGGGGRELGVLTAAGGGAKVPIDSASPVAVTVLVADADGEPPVELFVSDGRGVELWTFADCMLQPVVGPDGQPYLFDLGALRGTGTGVGCVDADGDGGRDLVGLYAEYTDHTTVDWTRTIVERDGLQASSGATDGGRFHQPEDADAIELLHGVTCGEVTIADGVTQPE